MPDNSLTVRQQQQMISALNRLHRTGTLDAKSIHQLRKLFKECTAVEASSVLMATHREAQNKIKEKTQNTAQGEFPDVNQLQSILENLASIEQQPKSR